MKRNQLTKKLKAVDNYIELDSIGHYLCPIKMEIYPIHTDGTADYESALPVEEIDEENGISSEDLGKIADAKGGEG
mgnify:CR=1 FL=1